MKKKPTRRSWLISLIVGGAVTSTLSLLLRWRWRHKGRKAPNASDTDE